MSLSITHSFVAHTDILSEQVNQNFQDVQTWASNLFTNLLSSNRTIDSAADRTIASATPAAIGTHSISFTVNSTSDVVYAAFTMSFFSNDTSSYYNFSIGYDSTSRIQAGSQISFLGGSGEGNRKIVTFVDVITGLSAGSYAFKPFWSRTAGTGTGTCVKDTSVFAAFILRSV